MLPENPQGAPETPERAAAPVEAEVEHELGRDVPTRHNPYEVLRLSGFRNYLIGGVFAAAGSQMTTLAAGWEVYRRTNHAFSLALLGLMSALPVILLALPAGSLADRYDRKKIVMRGEICACACLLALAAASRAGAPLWVFYGLILANAICGAFMGPAVQAIGVTLVPPELLPPAMKWSSIRWQVAATVGPVLAGYLVERLRHEWGIYALDGLGRLCFAALLIPIQPRPQEYSKEPLNWQSVIAGWHFIKAQPLILSTITLDMVAVLFGGATALLPIYAKDILKVGAQGLGPMRAAPAIGAIIMAFFLAHMPPMKRAGTTLLWAVAGFGVATIIFGLSPQIAGHIGHNPELNLAYIIALAALFSLGALDNISVVIRHTLLQVLTPDSMRGRVSAVNSVFIGTSNEIGEVESGVAAGLFGPIIAVAGGGVLTILTVLGVAAIFPAIKTFGSLEEAAARKDAESTTSCEPVAT